MKSALQKAGSTRNFVSPSYASDIKQAVETVTQPTFSLKDAAGLAMSLWPLRRFPRLTVLGLIAAGIYIGVTRTKAKRAAKLAKTVTH